MRGSGVLAMMIAIDTDTETITVEGMSFSFDFFHCFSKPDPRDLYSFEEVGGVVNRLVTPLRLIVRHTAGEDGGTE